MKSVELLAPAGNSEKLKIAIHYGADAVYLAGKEFSLRNQSGNFTLEEMENAIEYAHSHSAKAYIAVNIYPRNNELTEIASYISRVASFRPDAFIIADPGIIDIAKKHAPDIPIHLSTQSNTTNAQTAKFWKQIGVERINTARELSLEEIHEISTSSEIEVESFIHGAMCISYSGRCLLSNYMAERDSNRGACCHPCRWKYTLEEEKRPGHHYPVMEDDRGTYIFNSKDLCMINHIPELFKAGIDSFKIEGRMKGINYLATTVNTYRHAIDSFVRAPLDYTVKQEWTEALQGINNRGYGTGFYLNDPNGTLSNFSNIKPSSPPLFVGKTTEDTINGSTRVEARNKITAGDSVEILSPKSFKTNDRVVEIKNMSGDLQQHAQPNEIVDIVFQHRYPPLSIIRAIKG